MLLNEKIILVTGSSHGIGADIARSLSQYGANVAINYLSSKDSAEKLAAELTTATVAAIAVQADVRDAAQVERMIAEVVKRFGRIDGIVNNAIGGAQQGKFADIGWAEYSNMLDFCCKAVVNTVKATEPYMRQQNGGRIVNIVTELWNLGNAEWSAYIAGKGAMVGLSRSLANELGPENITVNMVAPGWMADDKVDTSSEVSTGFGKSLPLGRHGSAREVGNACVFLMSDLASYITGAYIPVTGGRITQMGS
jgi:3-oxoacyl-[acyl-carrier protein] reductase